MIRVFPRKTKWTPTDELAFIGDPPLFRPPGEIIYISIAFTWDRTEGYRLASAWRQFYPTVFLDGPALNSKGGEFEPGQFVKEGVTITSRGCPRKCLWCFVPQREGKIRELDIKPGNDIADNNLLACSRDHIERVFEMLKGQREIKFSGGLDSRLLEQWHVDLMKQVALRFAWFACDYPGAESQLEKVADLMSDFPHQKKRCYVLVGHDREETPLIAETRCQKIYNLGFDPFAMLYRDTNMKKHDPQWSKFLRKWCRPAAYRNRDGESSSGKWTHRYSE